MFVAEKTFNIVNMDFDIDDQSQKYIINLVKIYMKEHLNPELFIELEKIDSDKIVYDDYVELLGKIIVTSFSNKDDNEDKIINDIFLKFKDISNDITTFILATDLNKSTKDYHITFAKAFVNGIIDRCLRCAVEGQKKELISLVKIEM